LKLLFITYINRSGSTFLANLFSRYSDIVVCPEGEVLVTKFLNHPLSKSSIKIPELFRNDIKLKYWNLERSHLEKIDANLNNIDKFYEILNTYRSRINSKASIIVFKAVELIYTYNKIPQITKEKYNIKYISIIRDGRASFASQKETYYLGKPMETNPWLAARKWNRHVNLSMKHLNNEDFFVLTYENLIRKMKETMHDLITKLNFNLDNNNFSKKGNYFEMILPTQKSMHRDIQKLPDPSKINNWKLKLTNNEIYIFEKVSKYTFEKSRYGLISPKVQFFKAFLLFSIYTFKGLVSILYHFLRISLN